MHAAVLELALAESRGTVAGATARTMAMLAALKTAVLDFTPPDGGDVRYGLTPYLNACVSFLWDEGRPPCVPQRNSVKWLKAVIATVRPPPWLTLLVRHVGSSVAAKGVDQNLSLIHI